MNFYKVEVFQILSFCRYFYLIVFAMYVREVGPKDYNQTFKQWMEDHTDLREMIAEGRSKLEWERKIPDEKLVNLKEMLDSADFKANLPKVLVNQNTKIKRSLKCFSIGYQEDLRIGLGAIL